MKNSNSNSSSDSLRLISKTTCCLCKWIFATFPPNSNELDLTSTALCYSCSLSDSALPTGGFVASSGLESFYQHGFISSSSSSAAASTKSRSFSLLSFLEESLSSYAHLNLPFFDAAHDVVWALRDNLITTNTDADEAVKAITKLDADLEAMLLNHVARRASKAQGIALLALYGRAFAETATQAQVEPTQASLDALMEKLKFASRGRNATMYGHLAICFPVLCAALGLSLGTLRSFSSASIYADLLRASQARSRHLHLFLQARAILSSAVRLNLAGPYAAQRLLLVDIRQVVNKVLREEEERCSRRDSRRSGQSAAEADLDDEDGPATTWPLGEILAARHDQLHSRIFNS